MLWLLQLPCYKRLQRLQLHIQVGRNWPIEELASLLFFSLAIVTPALKLGHGLDYVRAGKAAAKRIEDFLQTPVIPFGQKTNLVTGSGSLIVEQLRFTDHGAIDDTTH